MLEKSNINTDEEQNYQKINKIMNEVINEKKNNIKIKIQMI